MEQIKVFEERIKIIPVYIENLNNLEFNTIKKRATEFILNTLKYLYSIEPETYYNSTFIYDLTDEIYNTSNIIFAKLNTSSCINDKSIAVKYSI